MPTGAALIDRVTGHTRMNGAAASADRALVLSYLQDAADRIALAAEPVHDPAPTIVTLGPVATYNTGTVTATSGSAAVVGVGTNWTSQMVGMYLTLTGDSPSTRKLYVVSAVGSTTTLTLADPYTGDQGGVAGRSYLLTMPSTWDITKAPFAMTGFIAIDEVRVSDTSGVNLPMSQVTMSDIDAQRTGTQVVGTPFEYAFDYPFLAMFPSPSQNTTLELKTVIDAPTMADSAVEITFLPKALQWGCLVTYATARALQYKEQDGWQGYMNEFLADRTAGLPAARQWVARSGGRQRAQPSTHGVVQTSPSQDFGPFR